MFQIIRLTASETRFYPESVKLGILAMRKKYVPHTKMDVPVG